MQNYQKFIDELFNLEIETVQYFVKNGQVLYPHDGWSLPEHYTAQQLVETPAERLPGYLADFMSLEKYNYHQKQNRYVDKLIGLQRRALTDFLLLDSQQTARFQADAKRKREQLTQLLKNAVEYQNAWKYNTLDDLPSLFLELRLLNAFTIINRPEASPHLWFAHYLCDAIMYKRGALSGLIEQIEETLQPVKFNQTPLFINESKGGGSNLPTPGFESYLVEKYRVILPYLKRHYTNKMPKHYVPMLFALQEYMETPLDQCEQQELHTAWSATFGEIGKYKAFNTAVAEYNNTSNLDKQQKIKNCKKLIVDELKGVK